MYVIGQIWSTPRSEEYFFLAQEEQLLVGQCLVCVAVIADPRFDRGTVYLAAKTAVCGIQLSVAVSVCTVVQGCF
jgi:hypothetical protein